MGEHGRRARGLATLAATAVLVVGAAAACQLGTWMGEDGPAVAVIGDSLVDQAEGNLGTVTGQRLLADELASFQLKWEGCSSHSTPDGRGASSEFGQSWESASANTKCSKAPGSARKGSRSRNLRAQAGR